MQRKLKWLLVFAVVGVTAYAAGAVLATPPVGVTGIPLAQGQFGEIDAKTLSSSWQARIDTKGESDLYILENRIAPGGRFGWHSHPGPSLVIVKSGALTLYQGTIRPARRKSSRPGRASSTTAVMSISSGTKAASRRTCT